MLNISIKNLRLLIDDLSGLAFNDSSPYSEKEKVFFEDRYYKILSLLPLIKTNDIGLEIGLAGGVLALALKRFYNLKKLYTLEHPVAYKKYSEQFLKKIRDNNIFLQPVDLRLGRFPWDENMFDFIIFSEVMEHLVPADIPQILNEINRILKKGGWILLTTPNIASLLKRINLLSGKNPIEFDLHLHEDATFGHIREYTLSEAVSILKENNFLVVKQGYYCIDTKRNIFTQIEAYFSVLYTSFGNNIFVIAKKL